MPERTQGPPFKSDPPCGVTSRTNRPARNRLPPTPLF